MAKRTVFFGLYIILILLPISAQAVQPHDASNGVRCTDCHEIIKQGGKLQVNLPQGEEQEAVCKTCHSPGGEAETMSNVGNHLVNGGETIIDCGSCHNPHRLETTTDPHTDTEAANLKLIRGKTKHVDGALNLAIFQQSPEHFAFDEDNEPWNGICQTCHTQTNHHTNDDSADHSHFIDTTCTSCHSHEEGFMPGGGTCGSCHGVYPDGTSFPNTAGSHATHFDAANGPGIQGSYCQDCHPNFGAGKHMNGIVSFASGVDSDGNGNIELDETDVCDVCHGPDGVYNGVDDSNIGAKVNWNDGVYDGNNLKTGREEWCAGCHDYTDPTEETPSTVQGTDAPPVAGDGDTWGYFASGHGRSHNITCTRCHDATSTHMDGEPRTYAFDSSYYGPDDSGVAYAAGYRLLDVDGDVPLMIPANYGITFSYDAGLIRDTAFRLCFDCHDSSKTFDNTPGDGTDSNFKASLPNPPRNYSYAWGSGADVNEHVSHIMNYVGPFSDSDWDIGTNGPGGSNGCDTLTMCSSCHNVHGAAGTQGSTNEPMVRDGTLVGRTGYGFSYVIEDVGSGGYPQVTSIGATQLNNDGAIFRNNTSNMCAGSMCHGTPTPPPASSYDASGSSWGTYLEYYRPWEEYYGCLDCHDIHGG